jgi:hypothetical protein
LPAHQSLLGRGLADFREDLWLKIGKVIEYRFVSVLSLLYVVFIELDDDGAGDECGRVILGASTSFHMDGMFFDVVTTI